MWHCNTARVFMCPHFSLKIFRLPWFHRERQASADVSFTTATWSERYHATCTGKKNPTRILKKQKSLERSRSSAQRAASGYFSKKVLWSVCNYMQLHGRDVCLRWRLNPIPVSAFCVLTVKVLCFLKFPCVSFITRSRWLHLVISLTSPFPVAILKLVK